MHKIFACFLSILWVQKNNFHIGRGEKMVSPLFIPKLFDPFEIENSIK